MKDVFIVLSDTGSALTKAIKFFTNKPYNHASIALDEDLTTLYSFGRKRPNNPLIGGFVEEELNEGTYKRFPNTRCMVLKVEVEEEVYNKLKYMIKGFIENKDAYHYNFIGLFGVLINKPILRKNYYFCSSFVADVAIQSGVIKELESPHMVKPHDFESLLEQSEIIYEGYMRDYK